MDIVLTITTVISFSTLVISGLFWACDELEFENVWDWIAYTLVWPLHLMKAFYKQLFK